MPGFDLTGRVAIVSGGSQGMGRAYCLELAGAGADVAVVARMQEPVTGGRSRPHEPVERVVEEVQALGRRALGVTADVREPDQVTEMVRQVHETFGRIDILVNVAGGSWGETFRSGPLAEIDHNDLVEAFLVNVKTTFLCSSTVAPIMMEQGKGAIINIASSSGVGGESGDGGVRGREGRADQPEPDNGGGVGAEGAGERDPAGRHRQLPPADVDRRGRAAGARRGRRRCGGTPPRRSTAAWWCSLPPTRAGS